MVCNIEGNRPPIIGVADHVKRFQERRALQSAQRGRFRCALILSPNVYIGSDVKPSATQGPVTIEGRSDVKIKASNGVLIKNDFEVKAGATFEISQ